MTIEEIEQKNFEHCSKEELLSIQVEAYIQLSFGSWNREKYSRWYKIYDRAGKTLDVYYP